MLDPTVFGAWMYCFFLFFVFFSVFCLLKLTRVVSFIVVSSLNISSDGMAALSRETGVLLTLWCSYLWHMYFHALSLARACVCARACICVQSHWRHAAIVLPEDLPVARDDTLQLDACVQSACVGLSIKHVPTEN